MTSTCFLDKVKEHCIDGKIEYVIVTSSNTYSISQMVDIIEKRQVKAKGVLNEFEIGTLIDYGISDDPSQGAEVSLYKSYNTQKEALKRNGTQYYSASSIQNKPLSITEDLSLNILKNPYYNNIGVDKKESSVCCYVEFCGRKMLFLGNISKKGEQGLIEELSNDFSNVIFFNAVDYGYSDANSKELLNKIKNKQERLYITINSVANENIFGKRILTKALCDRLISTSEYCYLTVEKTNKGKYVEVCGDISFSIESKQGEFIGAPSLKGANKTPLLMYTNYYKGL